MGDALHVMVVSIECLTSRKKTRFSNREGWVFNRLSFISKSSPLHLFDISATKNNNNKTSNIDQNIDLGFKIRNTIYFT